MVWKQPAPPLVHQLATGSEKLRATSTAGLCESLNLPSAARRLQEAVGFLFLLSVFDGAMHGELRKLDFCVEGMIQVPKIQIDLVIFGDR